MIKAGNFARLQPTLRLTLLDMEPNQIQHWTRVLRRPWNGLHENEAASGNPSKIPFLSVSVNKSRRYCGRRHLLYCHAFFGVTWPLLPNMAGYCWVSCAEAAFCAFVCLKGWEGAPFQASSNDNTLATIVQLSTAVFYHTNANHYMKTRPKSFQWFEKPPVSRACSHLELDSHTIA